jgi:hypothetical protein
VKDIRIFGLLKRDPLAINHDMELFVALCDLRASRIGPGSFERWS